MSTLDCRSCRAFAMPRAAGPGEPAGPVRGRFPYPFVRRGAVLAGLAFLFCSSPSAEVREPAPSIGSERPGFGDGAWVLAPGVWQMEAGARLRDFDDARAWEGSALLRRGLADLELRLYLPALLSMERDSDSWSDAHWSDLGLGLKLPLGGAAGWDWSVVGAATLPTGSSSVTADTVTGFVTLVGETRLNDRIGFALNTGASASAESSSTTSLSFIPTFTVGVSERASVYGGYAGFYGTGEDQHWLEAGIATAASPLFQWDINSAYETQSGDWFFGVGFSRRWLP